MANATIDFTAADSTTLDALSEFDVKFGGGSDLSITSNKLRANYTSNGGFGGYEFIDFSFTEDPHIRAQSRLENNHLSPVLIINRNNATGEAYFIRWSNSYVELWERTAGGSYIEIVPDVDFTVEPYNVPAITNIEDTEVHLYRSGDLIKVSFGGVEVISHDPTSNFTGGRVGIGSYYSNYSATDTLDDVQVFDASDDPNSVATIASVGGDNVVRDSESGIEITGINFEATQNTGKVELIQGAEVTALTVTAWSNTSITVAIPDVLTTKIQLGSVDLKVTTNGAQTSTISITLSPKVDWLYIDIGTPDLEPLNRVTSSPTDIATGDQLYYEGFIRDEADAITSYPAEVYDDGTYVIDAEVPGGIYSLDYYLFDTTDNTWSSVGTETINVTANTFGNVPPVFTSTATFSVVEGQTVEHTVTAVDSNSGDVLVFSEIGTWPEGFSLLNTVQGQAEITAAPPVGTFGEKVFTVRVSDGVVTVDQEITVTVTEIPISGPINVSTGDVNANAYISVTTADLYFQNRLYSDLWDAATTGDKEKALVTATTLLDHKVVWLGQKTDSTQSLAWPRVNVLDVDGVALDANTIPRFISIATCELAIALLGEDLISSYKEASKKKMHIGPIKIDYNEDMSRSLIPDLVMEMVRHYGEVLQTSSSIASNVSLVRA